MLSAFEQAGLFCDIYLTCEDARTAMTMAEKGLGIALLPASMLNLTHKLKACTITDADLTTEILLAWRKGAFRLNFGLFWNCGMKMTPSIIKFMFPNRNRLRQFFILIRFTDLN